MASTTTTTSRKDHDLLVHPVQKNTIEASHSTDCTLESSTSGASTALHVRFSPDPPQIFYDTNNNNNSDSDYYYYYDDYWFTRDELTKIKRRDQLLYELYQRQTPIDGTIHALRGLVETQWDDRKASQECVLQQQQQQDAHLLRPRQLARLYRQYSRPSLQLAWRRAQSDAAYVHAIDDNDGRQSTI